MFSRLLNKLNDRFNNGDYYEAHQIYKTLYYRLLRENKPDQVYDLLYNGALKFMEKEQYNSGADLAIMIVKMLGTLESSLQVKHTDDELIANIRTLFSCMKSKLSNESRVERLQFVSQSLQISYLSTSDIRKQFAEVLWTEKNFAEARLHFLYSSDSGNNCALMLIEYQTMFGCHHEIDLMIAQFVLQVLCCENKQLAVNTFHFYTMNHPQIKCTEPPFTTPLLNFICFLLIAIDNGKSILFNTLCSFYERSLKRDPCYSKYLEQIGHIYFGIEKKTKSGGLLSNLLQSLFDGTSNDEPNERSNENIAMVNNEEAELD